MAQNIGLRARRSSRLDVGRTPVTHGRNRGGTTRQDCESVVADGNRTGAGRARYRKRWRGYRSTNEAPASECHQGPRRRTHREAGYIVCSPILNPKAKTPLATQGKSIYFGRRCRRSTGRPSRQTDHPGACGLAHQRYNNYTVIIPANLVMRRHGFRIRPGQER
jgi:hypothetical protein